MKKEEYALHTGDAFDTLKETQTTTKLVQFLKSKGVNALVSKGIVLDYERKAASVTYKVGEGPTIAPEEPLLPGAKRCDLYVRNFIKTDIGRLYTSSRDCQHPLDQAHSLFFKRYNQEGKAGT